MTTEPLRIHVVNDPGGHPDLWIRPDTLAAGLERGGAPAYEVTFGVLPAPIETAHDETRVIFTSAKLHIGNAAERLPRLQWVQTVSAGVEVFLATLPTNITLTNASGVHSYKGAEFILTAALMLNYRIPTFVEDRQGRRWQPEFVTPICGKTVTLLGTGSIGLSAAHALKSRNCRVIGVSRSAVPDPALDKSVSVDQLDSVLGETDVLVSTLPLTSATQGLIDGRRLALLRAGAGIVIVGRANVFDCDALADALDAGRLSGAVMDVFPVEPLPPSHRLWSTRALLMTPHCSVDDHVGYVDRCIAIFADNLTRMAKGEPLRNAVNPALGY